MKNKIAGVFEQIKSQITRITEIKNRLEADIAEIQRESARRKIIEAIVFHETRLPLEAIGGILELSALARGGKTVVKNDAASSAIRFNLELISYLESFLTPEFDPDFCLETEFDFNEIMFTALCSSYSRFAARKMRLSIKFFDSPAVVRADKYKLYCVLLNLLDNACKFGASSDEVAVSTSVEEGALRVEMTDHGAGFDPESMKSLFPEGRLSVELEKNDPKTGLLIVYKYLQEMGGYLEAESRAGEGASIALYLRLSEKTDVKAVASEKPEFCDFSERIMEELSSDADLDGALKRVRRPAAAPVPPSRTLMIIDDDQAATAEFKRMVESLCDEGGETAFVAADAVFGKECLEAVRSRKPDMIFVEPMQKNSDGFALIEKIKKSEDLAGVPLVVLSKIKCRVRSLNLGACDYVQKPLKDSVLAELVKKNLPCGGVRPEKMG